MQPLAMLPIAYLIGSIPFGLILTRLAGQGDIRAIGSGNIGATNVLRTGKKGLALATLLLDGGKGAAAVIVARLLFPELQEVWAYAGLAAILGHLYPVWLKFKGGKGVATSLGVWLALDWRIGVALLLVWIGVFAARRISSLSALTAFALSVPLAFVLDRPLTLFALLVAALVFVRHRENIRRLIRKEEPRFGSPKPSSEAAVP